jgi:putative FmdB family regulatory protein
MPMYTFSCINCDISKEEQLSIAQRDSTRVECPQCGNAMVRGIDRPGLVWAPTSGGMK